MQTPNAWVFDVDGVLTDPQQKKITDPLLLTDFINWLKKNEPVILNTGRSLAWLDEKIINPLREKIARQKENPHLLNNLFIVGEKGAIWRNYTNGQPTEEKDKTITMPQELQEEIKKLINQKFSDTYFFDDTKQTMISLEILDNVSLQKFHAAQKELNPLAEQILQTPKYRHLKIAPSIIATDIENQKVGKNLGAQKIIHWLKEKHLRPQAFFTFGDTESDIEMARELQKAYPAAPVTFVYTGKNFPWPKQNLPFKTIHSPGFQTGTRRFLQEHVL